MSNTMEGTRDTVTGQPVSLVSRFLAEMQERGPQVITGARMRTDWSKVPAFAEALRVIGNPGNGQGFPVPADLVPGARTFYGPEDTRPRLWFPTVNGPDGRVPKVHNTRDKDGKVIDSRTTDEWLDDEWRTKARNSVSNTASKLRGVLAEIDEAGDYTIQTGIVGDGYGIVAVYVGELAPEQVSARKELAEAKKRSEQVSDMVDAAIFEDDDDV